MTIRKFFSCFYKFLKNLHPSTRAFFIFIFIFVFLLYILVFYFFFIVYTANYLWEFTAFCFMKTFTPLVGFDLAICIFLFISSVLAVYFVVIFCFFIKNRFDIYRWGYVERQSIKIRQSYRHPMVFIWDDFKEFMTFVYNDVKKCLKECEYCLKDKDDN
jgi:hypothetical protein